MRAEVFDPTLSFHADGNPVFPRLRGEFWKLASQSGRQQVDTQDNYGHDNQVRKDDCQRAGDSELATGNTNRPAEKLDQWSNQIGEEYRKDQEQNDAGQLYHYPARRLKKIVSKERNDDDAQHQTSLEPGRFDRGS